MSVARAFFGGGCRYIRPQSLSEDNSATHPRQAKPTRFALWRKKEPLRIKPTCYSAQRFSDCSERSVMRIDAWGAAASREEPAKQRGTTPDEVPRPEQLLFRIPTKDIQAKSKGVSADTPAKAQRYAYGNEVVAPQFEYVTWGRETEAFSLALRAHPIPGKGVQGKTEGVFRFIFGLDKYLSLGYAGVRK